MSSLRLDEKFSSQRAEGTGTTDVPPPFPPFTSWHIKNVLASDTHHTSSKSAKEIGHLGLSLTHCPR